MQQNQDEQFIRVDEDGRLVLSSELASRYGIIPGEKVYFRDEPDGLYMSRPGRLAKLYIEPTNLCNLNCRTCIRNQWDEPMGKMSDAVFANIIRGLRKLSSPPTIFFGGFGEPLFHPGIVRMVAEAKSLGAPVEMITNGTLLTPDLSQELIRAGLDRLWVSLDGATPESYTDVRLGAALPRVLENLAGFHKAVYAEASATCCFFVPKTSLGIVFVAMKRNIADLPEVVNIGKRFGAQNFLVTNVLPYTREMVDEALYYRGLSDSDFRHLNLPWMDLDENICSFVQQTLRNVYGPSAGIDPEREKNSCPFISSGAGAVGWDGGLSPCLPLLHNHTSYHSLSSYNERFSRRWIIGNVMESDLLELWNTPEHLAFRESVQSFVFAPCTRCGFCDMYTKNEEDCFGNTFPTCGGCMWAQGVVRCP